MGLLIAGARSTGTIGAHPFHSIFISSADGGSAAWLVAFLGCHPRWQAAALSEVHTLVSSHGESEDKTAGSGHTLDEHAKILSTIPLEVWESKTPVLDSLIRETLRIAQPHVAMRRNVGPEMYIDGKAIPTGAFVIYPFSDVHVNPDLYQDPWKFDPARLPAKGEFSYIGWGGGTCSITVRTFYQVVDPRTSQDE